MDAGVYNLGGHQTFADRFSSFQHPHQLSKRRASAQSKAKKATTVEWPHERPAPEDLARAGFFYRPATDSNDNVQCFCCAVKLDGWEEGDDPLKEHLAHSDSCAWAVALSTSRTEDEDPETRDPMSDEMLEARRGTFAIEKGWCHESKRGWRCKINKMVEAGWSFDPSPEAEDGVTCFYCTLSLDGWEPKDDPLEEHRKRSPDCPFYALVEQYHGGFEKEKGKGKGKARGSTASKASRLSAQSVVSGFSDAPSAADLGDGVSSMDDSVMSTASQATTKGRKKAGRPKAAAKGTKGKKKESIISQDMDVDVQYPDLSLQMDGAQSMPGQWDDSVVPEPEEELPLPKATRKATRQSKQMDSSVMEGSQIDAAPKKTTRGRKAKAKPTPEPEPEQETEDRVETPLRPEQRDSEVSAQLQEELDHSMDFEPPDGHSTPQPEPAKPKRGTKRTSNGMKKQDEPSLATEDASAPPRPAAKCKKGKKAAARAEEDEAQAQTQYHQSPPAEPIPEVQPESDVEVVKTAKAKKAPAKKGKGKGKKASSMRSSRATDTEDESAHPFRNEPEDLERDEREIEAELQRIADEQQAAVRPRAPTPVQEDQGRVEEYEPSPTPHKQQHANKIHELEANLHDEVEHITQPGENMAAYVAHVAATSPRPNTQPSQDRVQTHNHHNATPSPSGSDKENYPSSVLQQHPSTVKAAKPNPTILLSPTKTTRIPLAPGTPNRSPSRPRSHLSPSKTLTHLTSTTPWHPVPDSLLDTLLFASPQPTPGSLGKQLKDAAGGLSEEEEGMSVEVWVRWRAERAEEELRRRCERLVGGFEGEGNRALEALGGIETVV